MTEKLWRITDEASLCFLLLLILFFKIMPKRVVGYFLGEPFAVKGYRIIVYAISWLILLGALILLSLPLAELLDGVLNVVVEALLGPLFDAIFEFLHIG